MSFKSITDMQLLQTAQDKAAQERARKAAIDEARAKAKKLGKDLDVRLVRLVSFSESSGGYAPPLPYFAEALGKGGAVDTSISVGENEVRVNVTLTYEIK